jgi:predicted Rossmann fold flavoprotein
LVVNALPGHTSEELDSAFQKGGNLSVLTLVRRVKKAAVAKAPENCAEGVELAGDLPERLVATLCSISGTDPSTLCHSLTREQRKAIVTSLTALALPITGTRGYTYAEVTAGGVPLSELHLDTMQSRICPGLHFCGEILDVDGQIGGYNFQWAWASGFLAGSAAAL